MSKIDVAEILELYQQSLGKSYAVDVINVLGVLSGQPQFLTQLSEDPGFLDTFTNFSRDINGLPPPGRTGLLKFFVNISGVESLREPLFDKVLSHFLRDVEIPSLDPSLVPFVCMILSNLSLNDMVLGSLAEFFIMEQSPLVQLIRSAEALKGLSSFEAVRVLLNFSRNSQIQAWLVLTEKAIFREFIVGSLDVSENELCCLQLGIIKNCLFLKEACLEVLKDSGLLHSLCKMLLSKSNQILASDYDDMGISLKTLFSLSKVIPGTYELCDPRKDYSDDCLEAALDVIMLLCCSFDGRAALRTAYIYPILRNVHKAQSNSIINEKIDDIVQLLMRDESMDGTTSEA